MANILSLTLIAFGLLVVAWKPASAKQSCNANALTGAMWMRQKLYFYFGTTAYYYNKDKNRMSRPTTVTELFQNYPKIPIDAAYRQPKNPWHQILISGNQYYTAWNGKIIKGPMALRKIFRRNKKFAQGIDAAATTTRKRIFYFKGCVINKAMKNGARHLSSLKRMGIPCYVDAAWEENGFIIVSKGPFSWKIDPDTNKAMLHCFYCTPTVDTAILN